MRDVMAMRGLAMMLALALGGCATSAPALPPAHPASASAPTGRLAGPPPSTRLGAVSYPDVPLRGAQKPADHHHHQH